MHNSLKTHPSRQMFEANPKLWKKKTPNLSTFVIFTVLGYDQPTNYTM